MGKGLARAYRFMHISQGCTKVKQEAWAYQLCRTGHMIALQPELLHAELVAFSIHTYDHPVQGEGRHARSAKKSK